MAWFGKEKQPKGEVVKKVKIPEGLWIKCNHCREIIYKKEIERNNRVCPKCDYHFAISVEERIGLILDAGSFKEWDVSIYPLDPLQFKDSERYKDKLKKTQERAGTLDAFVAGEGMLHKRPVVFGVFNFHFMGGSMGAVVGEKITRAIERAVARRTPLIIVSASGGARMQEGVLSLMQMAKTSAAVARLKDARVPFISILTDPTFGGVSASFALLGDIIIAEPKALIGFAGPRVIEQTIKQQLPKEFQRSEFLLEHGLIDLIVDRKRMKDTLSTLLEFFDSGR